MNDIYKEGYFRPLSNKTPDLVTIEITSPNALNIQKSLLQVPSSNQLCPNKIYFYVDSEFTIHYLSLDSTDLLKVPLCFKSLGFPPQLGCSGSPIFMAQVIVGKKPEWKFTVVAAVFANSQITQTPKNQFFLTPKPPPNDFIWVAEGKFRRGGGGALF